jgi:hypothetical protein
VPYTSRDVGKQKARFPRRRPSPCDYLRSSSRPNHTHRLLRSRRLTAILRPPPGSVKAPRLRSRDTGSVYAQGTLSVDGGAALPREQVDSGCHASRDGSGREDRDPRDSFRGRRCDLPHHRRSGRPSIYHLEGSGRPRGRGRVGPHSAGVSSRRAADRIPAHHRLQRLRIGRGNGWDPDRGSLGRSRFAQVSLASRFVGPPPIAMPPPPASQPGTAATAILATMSFVVASILRTDRVSLPSVGEMETHALLYPTARDVSGRRRTASSPPAPGPRRTTPRGARGGPGTERLVPLSDGPATAGEPIHAAPSVPNGWFSPSVGAFPQASATPVPPHAATRARDGPAIAA